MFIEHWRDNELLAKIHATDMFISVRCGKMCITLPPGLIELATEDELHFDPWDMIEFLNEYTRGKSEEPS